MICFPDLPKNPTNAEAADRIADWLELMVIVDGRTIKRGDLAIDIPWGTDAVNYISRDDALIDAVWSLLLKRRDQLSSSWPFMVNKLRLTLRHNFMGHARAVYTFMLLLSRSDIVTDSDRSLFEYICVEVISGWSNSKGYRIGAPARRGEPNSAKERFSVYAEAARLSGSELGGGLLPDDKDLGLDAVIWRPFLDRRSGEMHAWLQCATGRDWINKTYDIDEKVIGRHLLPASGVVRLMAIPFIAIYPETKWQRYLMKAGVILDRTRVAELARHASISEASLDAVRNRLNTEWEHQHVLIGRQ